MTSSDAAANRKKRAAILKKRREDGKAKPVISSVRKKKHAEVARLKAEKLAMKKELQKQKKTMADEIKAGKKKINDERKRNAKLEKELRERRAKDKKVEREKKKQTLCKDSELAILHQKMVLAVPTVLQMKNFTSKDHSLHREAMISTWTALRKYLTVCNKIHFESSKKKKASKAPRGGHHSNAPVFKNRPLFLPDIGEPIDEAEYKKVTRQLFGNKSKSSGEKKKKKKKRIAPTFVGPA